MENIMIYMGSIAIKSKGLLKIRIHGEMPNEKI